MMVISTKTHKKYEPLLCGSLATMKTVDGGNDIEQGMAKAFNIISRLGNKETDDI